MCLAISVSKGPTMVYTLSSSWTAVFSNVNFTLNTLLHPLKIFVQTHSVRLGTEAGMCPIFHGLIEHVLINIKSDLILITEINKFLLFVLLLSNSDKAFLLVGHNFLLLFIFESFCSSMNFPYIFIFKLGQLLCKHILVGEICHVLFDHFSASIHLVFKIPMLLLNFIIVVSFPIAHIFKLLSSFIFEIHPTLMHGVISLAKSFILSMFILLKLIEYLIHVSFLVILISLNFLNKVVIFLWCFSTSFGHYIIMIIFGSLKFGWDRKKFSVYVLHKFPVLRPFELMCSIAFLFLNAYIFEHLIMPFLFNFPNFNVEFLLVLFPVENV